MPDGVSTIPFTADEIVTFTGEEVEGLGKVTWKGPRSFVPFLRPVRQLKQHPDNTRKGDVGMVATSLHKFGQLKQIVLHQYSEAHEHHDAGTVIVAGNHTTQGIEQLTWTHAAVVQPGLTDDEADQFLLMDNRASDTATYDDAELVKLLERHMEAGTLDGTGYDADDVDDLMAALDAARTTEEEEFGGDHAEDPAQTQARVLDRNEGNMRELLIHIPAEHFDEFREGVADLKQAYEVDTAGMALVGAVRETRQRAIQDRDA